MPPLKFKVSTINPNPQSRKKANICPQIQFLEQRKMQPMILSMAFPATGSQPPAFFPLAVTRNLALEITVGRKGGVRLLSNKLLSQIIINVLSRLSSKYLPTAITFSVFMLFRYHAKVSRGSWENTVFSSSLSCMNSKDQCFSKNSTALSKLM